MIASKKETSFALKCTNEPGHECKREECIYFCIADEEEIAKFLEANDMNRSDFSDEFFECCNFEQIGLDAAHWIDQDAWKPFPAENVDKKAFYLVWNSHAKEPQIMIGWALTLQHYPNVYTHYKLIDGGPEE